MHGCTCTVVMLAVDLSYACTTRDNSLPRKLEVMDLDSLSFWCSDYVPDLRSEAQWSIDLDVASSAAA